MPKWGPMQEARERALAEEGDEEVVMAVVGGTLFDYGYNIVMNMEKELTMLALFHK